MQNQDKIDNSSYSLEPKEGMGHYVFAQIDGRMTKVHVTDEVYKAIARMDQDERDRIADQSRCSVAGKDGKLVRCTHKCGECPFYERTQGMRNGMPVSPEFLMEEYELEIAGKDDPATEYEALERREAVDRAVSLLPDADRAIVHMRDWEEKTTEQIARAMGMSQTGAAKRLRKIEGLLRERLSALVSK